MRIENSEMFLTTDKLEHHMRELEAFRFIGMKTIAPFAAMEGELGADEVYRAMPEKVEGGSVGIGDEFAGRDRYLWARKTVALPEHTDGCEVYGLFDFGKTGGGHNSGFESLLYVDGHPFQGVDTNHNDVNFECLAGRTVELTFLLWTGLEGGGFKREFRHRIRQAEIGWLHSATDELYYLAKAIVKTLRLLEDTSTAKYRLTQALERAFAQLDWDGERFHASVSPALALLKDELSRMKKDSDVTVNVIGHTHIDVAWLWRLKHTREKAQRSFSTVLKLMDEFEEYTFLQSQPQLYQYIKQDSPELYEHMKQRIAEGRWETDGGMWLEADCNLSSGEALTRQFLYGMRLFIQEFGHRCEYLWLPDVFGYSGALPQILRGVGIDTFMTTKISWNQFNSMPHDLFKWRGIDGSEVMAYFITTPEIGHELDGRFSTYNGMISPRAVLGNWKKFKDKNLSSETLLSYGYGDGGGGVNRNMLKMRRAMELLPALPNVKPTRAGDFFRRLHHSIETTDQYVHTWDGEMYLEYHRGTYTSQAWNKRMNRRLELALAEVEWLSELAMLSGGKYDQDALTAAWQTVLRNQFHDIIPGSSINEVYEDCHVEYGETAETLRRLAADALDTLCVPERDAYTLWHFGSFARKEPVFIPETRNGVFTDENGNQPRMQKTENGYLVSIELPPLSAITLRFTEAELPSAPAAFRVDMARRTLRTPFYEAEWNEHGRFTRIFDTENRREVVAAGEEANALRVFEDKPIAHDNWDIYIYHLFRYEDAELTGEPELVECGALRTVLRFRYAYRHSTLVQDVIFYAEQRRIDFATEADWHEEHRVLKAQFPTTIRSTRATYDIQYGHVERPTHFNTSWDYARFEVCAHKWADLSEEGYGVSLLNDCKYGHSTKDHLMSLTLLKSGKYPATECDMGHHAFTYALLPHAGTVAAGDTIEESVKLNLPVRVLSGASAKLSPTFRSDSRSVSFDAVKKAEDDDCLIVRIHECRGSHARAELLSGLPITAYQPCNLLEEPLGEKISGASIQTCLHPFEIQTFRVWTR